MTFSPNRRRFLTALGAGAASLPLLNLPGFAAARAANTGNILILIELAGGNDGLNTVVPVTDPAYRGLRPTIGLNKSTTLSLDRDTGLHPAMRDMADLWEDGTLSIVEGVGYPNPNRSHFRSIEIWNAGMGAESTSETGWISTAFSEGRAPQADVASGVTLGGDMGPLRGPGRFSALRDEEGFAEMIESLPNRRHAVRPVLASSPLGHVLNTYDSAQITGEGISRRLERSAARHFAFPDTELGNQLRVAARLLEAGVDAPVLKVVQDGYDTHDNQPDEHSLLLSDLSEAVGAFASAMKTIGLWDQVTMVTYSEFGRTARENASFGTDHGTAAPVFVAGGQVAGGFAGKRVSLDRLVDGDLVHTSDYRGVYLGLLSDLWGIEAPELAASDIRPIRVF
ncbi:DUF1501 domain-containing protein [Shimia ponticola]|uniref:DUF1501 domain-containing protein n=1 Tax=Shimia ponticola TaxID=2582893 RepID=UPI0011BD9898|nr:DUF1501 domain-containing protein [Shimia ponticola]